MGDAVAGDGIVGAPAAGRALDHLTGLVGPEGLHDEITRRLGTDDRVTALVHLDVDRFAWINECVGHRWADMILRELARRLGEAAGPADHLARLGGDGFAIVATVADARAAERYATRVLALVDDVIVIGDPAVELMVSMTAGIACAGVGHEDVGDSGELLHRADVALHRAKREARGSCAMYDAVLSARRSERLILENELRRGLDEGELRLHYQPVQTLTDDTITAVEALVRWEHPTRGLLGPAAFLDVAHESGLIVPLGRWVVRAACNQLAAWDRQLGGPLELGVFVNVSATELVSAHFVSAVRSALATAMIDPDRLTIEITEHVLVEEAVRTRRVIETLREDGVRVAIDDFGTGWSSLAYLRELPVDLMKIDGTFTRGVGSDPRDSSIVAAVVGLAHAFGIAAVIEGLETTPQVRASRLLGCDLGQGYALGRPMAPGPLMAEFAPRIPRPATYPGPLVGRTSPGVPAGPAPATEPPAGTVGSDSLCTDRATGPGPQEGEP
ncbi:MAG: bifunctional diguanylate cyclase/phosphodiesterase [Actinomycetota bacterium]|nr:bifunctional diguanylate cyclase/phosphodiesterase [Actinomycetota bacterium]